MRENTILEQFYESLPKSAQTRVSPQFCKIKGNAQFIFLGNLQKSSANVCLMKILKSTVTKKSNYVLL